jgi:hypothetical protein
MTAVATVDYAALRARLDLPDADTVDAQAEALRARRREELALLEYARLNDGATGPSAAVLRIRVLRRAEVDAIEAFLTGHGLPLEELA